MRENQDEETKSVESSSDFAIPSVLLVTAVGTLQVTGQTRSPVSCSLYQIYSGTREGR